jgi:tetratricopeptide (TPR) repeat protein
MKCTIKFLALFFGVLMLVNVAYAESPREQLQQMVEQLQKSPTDTALREKIIRLAQEIKPPPVVPEEARRYLARGIAAFETAKSTEEFRRAVPEFQNAANAAPWWSDTYFNMAKVQEKTGDLEGAIASYHFYLIADPNAKDAESIRTYSYKLEFMAEQKGKVDEAKAKAENAKKQRQAWAAEIVQWLRQNYGGIEVIFWSGDSTAIDGLGRRLSYSIGGNDMDQIKMVEPMYPRPGYCGIPSSSNVRGVEWRDCNNGALFDINFTSMKKNHHPGIVITSGDTTSGEPRNWTIELEP